MKRFFDVAVSLSLLVIAAPIGLFIVVLIKLDSPGPVIFRQARVGKDGRIFELLKFRTMVEDAQDLGGHSTQVNDKRITRVGVKLRRSSLDELPQLLNVLLGDMSLVGPRPNVPAQKAEYTDTQWNRRHSVRPGITGLAQGTLRSSATWQQRVDLDLEYVSRNSFALDVKILCMTVRQVVFEGGN